MFLNGIQRTLFATTARFRGQTKAEPKGIAAVPKFAEPSPAIRAAVRRHRLGLPSQSPRKDRAAWNAPVAYEAFPVHKRASARGGLASSEAMIITRFQISRADEEMSWLLGRKVEGRSVLDLDLSGLELAWHSDLMRALEDRVAVWSMSALIQPSGDHVLEHVVMPTRTGEGQLLLVGWYNRVGGSLQDCPTWKDVIDVRRARPGQRISESLAEVGVPEGVSGVEQQTPSDRVSEFRRLGAV